MMKQLFYKHANRGLYYIVFGLFLLMSGCYSPAEAEPLLTCKSIPMDEYAYMVSEKAVYDNRFSLYTECTEHTYSYWKITYTGKQEGIPFNFGFVGASYNDSWNGLIEESLCDFDVSENENRGIHRYEYTVTSRYRDVVHIEHLPHPYIMGTAWIQVDQTNRFTGKTERFRTDAITFWYPESPPLP